MKISLVGPMASGKTTIGRALAARLRWPFYDTDHWVEFKAGQTVADLFATLGEAKFRTLETEALRDLLLRPDDGVIATGGGIVLAEENRRLLHTHSRVVFLDVSVAEQIRRTRGDTTRPLLQVADKAKVLQSLSHTRRRFYQEIAHQTVAVDLLSPEAMIAMILNL